MVLFCVLPAAAQRLHIGGRAGAPLTESFDIDRPEYKQNTKRYTFGPIVEFDLPDVFSVELGALYKRFEYSFTGGRPVLRTSTTKASSWEFPVLLKEKKLVGTVRPYGAVGANFAWLRGIHETGTLVNSITRQTTNIDSDAPSELRRHNNIGFAAGGGVEFRRGTTRISPEVRYTRWAFAPFRDAPSGGNFKFNQNQVEVLVGITFGLR